MYMRLLWFQRSNLSRMFLMSRSWGKYEYHWGLSISIERLYSPLTEKWYSPLLDVPLWLSWQPYINCRSGPENTKLSLITTGTIFSNLFHFYYALWCYILQWSANSLQRCSIVEYWHQVSIKKANKSYCDSELIVLITQSQINVIFAVNKSTTLCSSKLDDTGFPAIVVCNHTMSLNTVILFCFCKKKNVF